MTYERNNSKELREYLAFSKKKAIDDSKKYQQEYFEYVRDNLDIFDREYCVEQLEAKGFVFPKEHAIAV